MANPTCSTTTLITNAACYRSSSIDPIQQKSLLIYGKILELAAIGGTDYTAAMTSTLLTDTSALTGPLSQDDLTAANISTQFVNAAAAGASVPDTIQNKIAAVKCLQHLPGGMLALNRIDALLNCKLGRAKAYPQ